MNYFEVINDCNVLLEEEKQMKDFINYCIKKLKLKNVMFNVIIIDNKKIHEINKKYRMIDRPTDVISFALEDNKENFISKIRMLGDIYISYEKVISQALDYNHSRDRELCFLAIHGLLHLLGYDHMNKEDEIKMFELQKELLNSYGIKK